MRVNNMDISFPHQLFIDNEFVDSSSGNKFNTINPNDESVSILKWLIDTFNRHDFSLL